jgi:adenosylcobinamide-GDP ribazoletransferase
LALIVAHAAARGLIVPVAAWLPTATDSGLGHLAGEPKLSTVQIAVLISATLLLVLLPVTTALASAAAACLAAAAIAALARHQIGGYTGDVLGAAEQAAETAILLTLAASAGV